MDSGRRGLQIPAMTARPVTEEWPVVFVSIPLCFVMEMFECPYAYRDAQGLCSCTYRVGQSRFTAASTGNTGFILVL